jgi:tRNA-specific 2-thiouridylase
VDFVKQYWNSVFATFIQQYAAGLTPNPDVLCNRHVKFGHLLQHARSLGASRLATGHYARVSALDGAAAGHVSLLRPSDAFKDQTYFLCQVRVHISNGISRFVSHLSSRIFCTRHLSLPCV